MSSDGRGLGSSLAGIAEHAGELEFFDDPVAFLTAAEEHLATNPLLSTVVASVTTRAIAGEGTHPALRAR
jgi:hypothetical protein